MPFDLSQLTDLTAHIPFNTLLSVGSAGVTFYFWLVKMRRVGGKEKDGKHWRSCLPPSSQKGFYQRKGSVRTRKGPIAMLVKPQPCRG